MPPVLVGFFLSPCSPCQSWWMVTTLSLSSLSFLSAVPNVLYGPFRSLFSLGDSFLHVLIVSGNWPFSINDVVASTSTFPHLPSLRLWPPVLYPFSSVTFGGSS